MGQILTSGNFGTVGLELILISSFCLSRIFENIFLQEEEKYILKNIKPGQQLFQYKLGEVITQFPYFTSQKRNWVS